MSSTVSLDENFFTCTICNDNYDDPRSLPCLHSFCRACLSQHICYSAMDSPPSFLCPVCRGLTLVPSGGKPMADWAEFFPGNFWLKDLMSQSSSSSKCPGGSGPLVLSTCLQHPGENLSVFCASCQVVVCESCISFRHNKCRQLVPLAQKNSSKNEIRLCVERLDEEIARAQTLCSEVEMELSYLSRQRDKAENAIGSHAATFILKIERAKKELFTKLDSDYRDMKRDIDRQLASDNGRLHQLNSLKVSAHEFMRKSPDAEDERKMQHVMKRINEALSSTNEVERPRFERMRTTFSPDYSWLRKDISLGSVTFYNSKLLAEKREGITVPPNLSRSHSSVQLRHPSDLGHPVPPSRTHLMQRPVSVPGQNDPVKRQTSGPQQQDTVQRPASTSWLQQEGEMQKSISAPVLQKNDSIQRPNSVSCLNQIDTDLATFQPSAYSMNATGPYESETSKEANTWREEYRSHVGKYVTPESMKSSPIFVCGEENIPSQAEIKTQMSENDIQGAVGNTPSDPGQQIHHQPGVQFSLAERVEEIPSRVLTRFPLTSEDDQHLPLITSIIYTACGYIIVADSANKSIKTFKNGIHCSTVNLEHKPLGLATALEERAVTSTPDSKEIVVISTGDESKMISRTRVQKCYGRLVNYRPGITAAVCADLGCIDLVTLQGRTMKSFRIFDQPGGDVPFCVDSNQQITVWDSWKSAFMALSKSGNKTYKEVCGFLKDSDVTGLTCDPSGVIYVVHDNKVAMTTRKGDRISAIENVFSCQCMCVSCDGDLCVAEIGGECKLLKLS